MRNALSFAFAIVLGTLAAGQSAPTPAAHAEKPLDAFALQRAQWARNLHDKQVEASIAEYAPDADFINPDGTRVHAMEALRQLFQTVTTTFDSDLSFDSQRVEVSGDLAYNSGTYRETLVVRATGKSQLATGSYLTVYKRGQSRMWLIVEQIWTGSVQ
jgi:ketosteroid isomerase-like protein